MVAGGAMFALSPPIMAQTADTATFSSGSESGTATSADSDQNDWVHRWLRTVDKARASQPHFVAPLVTTHVALVEQFRYDMAWQQDPVGGTVTSNYGASRGLEIIPTTRLEIGISTTPYLAHQSSVRDGYGDLYLQMK